MTTAGRLQDRLRVILAGRAAEIVAFGTATTYGTRDLRVRTGPRRLAPTCPFFGGGPRAYECNHRKQNTPKRRTTRWREIHDTVSKCHPRVTNLLHMVV